MKTKTLVRTCQWGRKHAPTLEFFVIKGIQPTERPQVWSEWWLSNLCGEQRWTKSLEKACENGCVWLNREQAKAVLTSSLREEDANFRPRLVRILCPSGKRFTAMAVLTDKDGNEIEKMIGPFGDKIGRTPEETAWNTACYNWGNDYDIHVYDVKEI